MKKKKVKQPTDVYWRCFPPFIDAYHCTDGLPDDYRKTTRRPKAIEDLKEAMKANALEWGMASIGEQTVRNGEPLELGHGGRLVLCVGYVWYEGTTGKEVTTKFVLALDRDKKGYWFENLEFLEFDWPGEWNVT